MSIENKSLRDSLAPRLAISTTDAVLLMVSILSTHAVLGLVRPGSIEGMNLGLVIALGLLCYLPACHCVPPTLQRRYAPADRIMGRAFFLSCLHTTLLTGALFMLPTIVVSRTFILGFFFVYTILLMIGRLVARQILERIRIQGHDMMPALLIGTGSEMEALHQQLQDKVYGYQFIHTLSEGTEQTQTDTENPADIADEAIAYMQTHPEVRTIFASCQMASATQEQLWRYCESKGITFHAVPSFPHAIHRRVETAYIGNAMTMHVGAEPLAHYKNKILKRSIDLIISGLVLLTVFPPLYLVFALIIKIQSHGAALTLQKAKGMNGRNYERIRFRTTHITKAVGSTTIGQEVQDFAFGRFLRRTGLDLIPQFLNVFLGSMSLVGHPYLNSTEMEGFMRHSKPYMIRHWGKPGMTGAAQLGPDAGEEQIIEQQVRYLENWTIWMDINILCRAIMQPLTRRISSLHPQGNKQQNNT